MGYYSGNITGRNVICFQPPSQNLEANRTPRNVSQGTEIKHSGSHWARMGHVILQNLFLKDSRAPEVLGRAQPKQEETGAGMPSALWRKPAALQGRHSTPDSHVLLPYAKDRRV